MSSKSSIHDMDIESQQQVYIVFNDPPRKYWRRIYLAMQACLSFISVADKAKNVSIPSAGVIGTGSEGDVKLEIREDEVLPASLPVADDSNVSQREKINQTVKDKNLVSLSAFGGVQGIAQALGTDLEMGILDDEDDLRSRRKVNMPSKARTPTQGLFQVLLKSCNNSVIFLLLVFAMLSIGFGIEEKGARTGWYEGAIIILAVITLVVVSFVREFWRGTSKKLLEEQRTSEEKEEIDVLRGGNWQKTIMSDVVPGDIVCLRRGNKVPGDGLFISGDKFPGDGLFVSENLKLDDGSKTINEENPFLNHGAKVLNGCGCMLVTSMGMNTSRNELMSGVNEGPSKTPLAAQLDMVSICTQIIGLLISIFILVVVFLYYKIGKQKHDNGVPETKGGQIPIEELMDSIKRIFMTQSGKFNSLITSLSVLVVGLVEGVPFVINLAIFYQNKKALRNKAVARESMACVSMGSVTIICTDKIGGLTLNQQEVGMCWIGEESITEDSVIHANVLEALFCGISTDVLMQQDSSNSTENPILSWAISNLGMEMEPLMQNCTIVDPKELQSSEGGSGVLLRKKKNKESVMCMHWKGRAEKILAKCSRYCDSEGTVKILDEEEHRSTFQQVIENMHSKNLETMAFAYQQVDGPTFEDNSLILIGLLGLKHICQAKIREAIEVCGNAGVKIVLISEDNLSTLIGIGTEYGLLCNSDGLVLEGEELRNCNNDEMMEMIDKICGIGNCLPSDKLKLVQCLKQKGHTVAMVGVTTNDIAALKEANVGITMGTWSRELARESSDIIILDGDFSSLVRILRCGRCTYNNIQKYIQLELTMVIAGLLITTIMTIASGNSPITAIEWCWANVIVAVSGGLALLTEQPSENLMEEPPISPTESFITKAMWRNIMSQALFQTVILVTFQFKSKSILKINDKVMETMIFNSFILCQVFNQFNSRDPHAKNMFKGIHRNIFSWVSVIVTLFLQALFIEIAHLVTDDEKLNGQQWGICFLIGSLSLPIDLAAKSTSSFIMILVTSPHCSQTPTQSVGMIHSESACNLDLPLINQDSTANP